MICMRGGLLRSRAGGSASGGWPEQEMNAGLAAGRIRPCEPRA